VLSHKIIKLVFAGIPKSNRLTLVANKFALRQLIAGSGVARNLSRLRKSEGVWVTNSGVQGRSPGGVWGQSPIGADLPGAVGADAPIDGRLMGAVHP